MCVESKMKDIITSQNQISEISGAKSYYITFALSNFIHLAL